MNEIFVYLQADVRTFFRMELRCEDIVASDGATEWNAVFRFADYVAGLVRDSVKTVDEIEETVIGNAVP